MTNNLLTLNDMAIFATIVKFKSFTKAAQELSLAKSTISLKLSKLEEKLETKLLNRTTRSLSLTKSGRILFKHCKLMIEEASLAENRIKNHIKLPAGKLKITCPEITGRQLLPKLISLFKNEYPKVEIELIITDQHIELVK